MAQGRVDKAPGLLLVEGFRRSRPGPDTINSSVGGNTSGSMGGHGNFPAAFSDTILAGSGILGDVDATGPAADFSAPAGIGIDASGNLFVAGNSFADTVRRVDPNGERHHRRFRRAVWAVWERRCGAARRRSV